MKCLWIIVLLTLTKVKCNVSVKGKEQNISEQFRSVQKNGLSCQVPGKYAGVKKQITTSDSAVLMSRNLVIMAQEGFSSDIDPG